jgi:hypothetical protein
MLLDVVDLQHHRPRRDPLGRAVREHLLGLPLLLLTVALAFGVFGLGSWAVGGVL